MLPAGNRLDDVYASLLERREAQGRLRQLTRATGVDFSSNGYLSLQANADVRDALLARLRERPASRRRGGGSRLLDGNSAAAEELERTLAAFHGAAAGLLFNSGFAANTGVFGCAPQAGDVVLYDELVHASVRDGLRLGRARAAAFAHNCVAGLDARLAKVLGDEGEMGRAVGAGRARVFVAVESVYSMDGDVAPLRGLVDCLDRRLPLGNGLLFVDEAHALGLFGHRGRGLVSHLGLQHRVWASLYTFGKALGCAGAIVLCSPTTRSYLINYARSLIYTTAMDHDALAGIQTSYEYLMSGQAEPLAGHVRSLTQCAHRLLTSLCSRRRPPPQLFRINPGEPQSPIIPLFTVQARSLARHCQQRGFVLRAIMAPTVPTSRVRLCLHAENSMQEVLGLCEAIEEWVCERLQWAKEKLSETPSKL